MSVSSYCLDEVKNNDYYRYICCLFAPENSREKLFSLYAFNNEIAKIKDLVTEPMTGMIRLTWWREAIAEIYAGKSPRNHTIVKALHELIQSAEIPHPLFEKLLDARETDLGFSEIITFDDLHSYINNTSANLMELSLHTLGIKTDQALKTAHYIGTAYALVGIMRSLKWNAAKRRILLPKNILEHHNISADDITEGRNLEKLKPIIRELCDKVEINLRHARALRKDLPKTASPVYLHAIISECFLKRIRKNNYDVFYSDLENGKVGVLWRMFWDGRV